jgi:hypothetical protein
VPCPGDGGPQRTGRFGKPQISCLFCKPVCKPDAAGQAETGETQKAREDFAKQVD